MTSEIRKDADDVKRVGDFMIRNQAIIILRLCDALDYLYTLIDIPEDAEASLCLVGENDSGIHIKLEIDHSLNEKRTRKHPSRLTMTFDIASFVIGFVLCGVVIAWALELHVNRKRQ